jgi:hypothetical protein
MTDDDRRDDMKTERDHPQTRKGEPDARGSSAWRDDGKPPEPDEATGTGGDAERPDDGGRD